jgi:hypothetical protein
MSNPSRIKKGSYKIEVFLQTFGGKIAGDRKGRGKAAGLMEYEDITNTKQGRKILEMIGEKK